MKISIIMCAFKSMPYIMSSVESFREQKHLDKELIIIYSKSDDNTEYYIKSIKDKNVKKFNLNGSVYECLNFGISKSRGDIIGILHSDDVFFSNKTLSYVNKEFLNKKTDLIYGNILFSKKNNLLEINRSWKNIKLKNKYDLPPHTGTFIKKKVYKKFTYNKNYFISSDTEFLIRLFKTNIKTSYMDKFICIMRHGGLSTSARHFFEKLIEDIKIYRKNDFSSLDYLKKLMSKSNQFFNLDNINNSHYLKKINDHSKVKFINERNILREKGTIISALNLAYIGFNHKYKLRNHKHFYWSDGLFSTFSTRKKKKPGRILFSRLLSVINSHKKNIRICILGDIPMITRLWLKDKLKVKYNYFKLPYGNEKKIIKSIKNINLRKKNLIILTLPTPKQELIANYLIKKFPNTNILCIGGSLNILSGFEKEVPTIFYMLNLEWLWRLRFDTIRRFKRLIESGLLYSKLKFTGKIDIF